MNTVCNFYRIFCRFAFCLMYKIHSIITIIVVLFVSLFFPSVVHIFGLKFLFFCSSVLFCIFSCGIVQFPILHQFLFLVIIMVYVMKMAMLITIFAPCLFLHPPTLRLTPLPARKLLLDHCRLVICVQ